MAATPTSELGDAPAEAVPEEADGKKTADVVGSYVAEEILSARTLQTQLLTAKEKIKKLKRERKQWLLQSKAFTQTNGATPSSSSNSISVFKKPPPRVKKDGNDSSSGSERDKMSVDSTESSDDREKDDFVVPAVALVRKRSTSDGELPLLPINVWSYTNKPELSPRRQRKTEMVPKATSAASLLPGRKTAILAATTAQGIQDSVILERMRKQGHDSKKKEENLKERAYDIIERQPKELTEEIKEEKKTETEVKDKQKGKDKGEDEVVKEKKKKVRKGSRERKPSKEAEKETKSRRLSEDKGKGEEKTPSPSSSGREKKRKSVKKSRASMKMEEKAEEDKGSPLAQVKAAETSGAGSRSPSHMKRSSSFNSSFESLEGYLPVRGGDVNSPAKGYIWGKSKILIDGIHAVTGMASFFPSQIQFNCSQYFLSDIGSEALVPAYTARGMHSHQAAPTPEERAKDVYSQLLESEKTYVRNLQTLLLVLAPSLPPLWC